MAFSRIEVIGSILALCSFSAFTLGCQGADLDKSRQSRRHGAVGAELQELDKVSRTQLSSAQLTATPVRAAPVQAEPAPSVQVPPLQQADPAQALRAAPVQAPRSTPMFQMVPAPVGEQTLDTNVGPQQPVSPVTAASNVPVLTTSNLKHSKVRTVSDEHLPKWVPVKGRLTVVDSSDLAENLGLVPKGTTKKSDERISVADKLQEESAARAAHGDAMTQGSSWSYAKAGKFRSRR